MNKLPSIISTYENTLQLFVKSYLPLLPFTVLAAVAAYIYNHYQLQFMAATQSGEHVNGMLMFAVYAGYSIIYCLIFAIALSGVAQFRKGPSLNYQQAIEQGIARTPSLLIMMVLLLSPLMLIMFGMIVMAAASQAVTGIFYLVMMVLCIAFLIAVMYFYVASSLIVVREHSAIKGLAHSYKITKGHWWKTFLILLILGVIVGLSAYGLGKIIPGYANAIMTLFVFPISCCLMLVHMENLENAYQQAPAVINKS